MATVVMRHKSFVGPTTYWNFRSLDENRENIRAQAEDFINTIGVENVVSVAEHAMSDRAILRRRVVSGRGGRAGRAAASGFYRLPYSGRWSRRLTRVVRPAVHRAGCASRRAPCNARNGVFLLP